MSTYYANVHWTRGKYEFLQQQYSRGHTWHFDEGLSVPASASPHVVRPQYAVSAAVDPEEALVAAVSSCHMLFALS
jgi:organic hydroperoxide reductase OsmC/OhrA